MKEKTKNTKLPQKQQSAKSALSPNGVKKRTTKKSDEDKTRPRPSERQLQKRKYNTSNPKKVEHLKNKTSHSEPASQRAERIAKRMARAGLCSRRDAEKWIESGRVIVNGNILTTPALTVTLSDKIEVDGNLLPGRERTRLWLYNKPSGLLSTNKDPEGRATIFEKLPSHLPRLLSVGRLDMNTEGLLLMTNDGGLARTLELPSTGWLRRYRVRAHGKVDAAKLDTLKQGIAVDGILYGSIEATIDREQSTNTWLTVAIREGKNREVKNVLGAIGLEVNRLIRISYGPFQLGDIKSGDIVEIRGRMLRDQLGERLVVQSGADFEAPIIHLAKIIQSDTGKTGSSKKPTPSSSKDKPRTKRLKKTAKGAIAIGTMQSLTTKRNATQIFTGKNPDRDKSGYNYSGKKKSGKSSAKFSRKPK